MVQTKLGHPNALTSRHNAAWLALRLSRNLVWPEQWNRGETYEQIRIDVRGLFDFRGGRVGPGQSKVGSVRRILVLAREPGFRRIERELQRRQRLLGVQFYAHVCCRG